MPLTDRAVVATLIALGGVDGPVVLAVAAVLPKALARKIVREGMRGARTLDRGGRGGNEADLMTRAINANRARGWCRDLSNHLDLVSAGDC